MRVDADLVDDSTGSESLHRPDKMGEVDSIHGGAVTDSLIEEENFTIGESIG